MQFRCDRAKGNFISMAFLGVTITYVHTYERQYM